MGHVVSRICIVVALGVLAAAGAQAAPLQALFERYGLIGT
jgi:hypothetical protein